MNKAIIFFAVLVILAVNPVSAATIYLEDGLSHIFDDNTYQSDNVTLDQSTVNTPGTHVDLVDGGSATAISTYNSATFTMSGGTISNSLYAHHASSITVSGGSIGGWFFANDNSTITMANGTIANGLQVYDNGAITMQGGVVSEWLRAFNNSTITMTGGSVIGRLTAWENAIIYLEGSGFKVNGTSLQYGDKLSDFAVLGNNGFEDYYYGTITGTLSDGSTLNNRFDIFNIAPFPGTADIIIIPEPYSLVLLSLGALLIRKK